MLIVIILLQATEIVVVNLLLYQDYGMSSANYQQEVAGARPLCQNWGALMAETSNELHECKSRLGERKQLEGHDALRLRHG